MEEKLIQRKKTQKIEEVSDDEPGIDDDYDGIGECKEEKPSVLNSNFL